MKIPFVGPAYQARSINVDAQRSVNCYLEMDNASPRAPVALYGTPGLTAKVTFAGSTGGVRACIHDYNVMWFVVGDEVYHVTAGYVATLWGTIATSSGPCSMAFSGDQVLIVDGVGGWYITNIAVVAISDVDFPNGVTTVSYQDGYFIVAGDGSGRFYISDLNDGSSWVGTEYATAEGSLDNIVGMISDHRELWLLGEDSAEVWINTGNAGFPFERSGNGFVQTGVMSAQTLAALDNSFFWLGRDNRGFGMVWRMNGYTPVRVSNHAIENAIQGYAVVSDATAYSLQVEGHSWYVLTFPTADKTWVFDAATGQWFEWLWRDSSGDLHRHRSSCHVFFNNTNLVGDWETGVVYAVEMDTYTDNGAAIKRLRTTTCQDSPDGARNFYQDLQVDMETGVGTASGAGVAPELSMRYSNDAGHTWSSAKTRSMGAAGEYGRRVKFGPSGAGRNRVWEISTTDPVKFAVLGAYSRFTKGTS